MKTTLRILSLTFIAFTCVYANEPAKPDLTKQQLKSLTATASTPEDHRKLAVYYEQKVQQETAEAQRAEQELKAEQANPAHRSTKQPNGRVNYFQWEVERHRKAAEKSQALIALHREKAGMAPGDASIAQSSTSTHDCCGMSCCARNGSC